MANPTNNSFENWNSAGNPGVTNGDCQNWDEFSVNGGTCTRGAIVPTGGGSYSALIRSSSGAPINSVGGLKSEAFALTNDYLMFWEVSQATNVSITIKIYDSTDALLGSYTKAGDGGWTQFYIDVRSLKGSSIKISFEQHTNQAGVGYWTYIDLVTCSDTHSGTSLPLVLPARNTILSHATIIRRTLSTLQSAAQVYCSKMFYGQLHARVSTEKDFYAQLQINQPAPLNPTSLVSIDLKMGDAIELTWVDSGNYAYNVYKDVGGTWIKQNATPLIAASSYIVGQLVTGVTYTFKVTGVNGFGTESSGVTKTGKPTLDLNLSTTPHYQIFIGGIEETTAIIDTVELVYAPAYCMAKFHYNKLPSDITLPNAARQEVVVFINSRLVFTGYLVKRENVWSSSDIRVNYEAIDKSWEYTWDTPRCINFIMPPMQYPSQTVIHAGGTIEYIENKNYIGRNNAVLQAIGAPIGLPIKDLLPTTNIEDNVIRDIMVQFTADAGDCLMHCDENGVVSYYQQGQPLFKRVYEIGKHILDLHDTTDITDKIDYVTVIGPPSRLKTVKDVGWQIEGLLVASAEMNDVASPNISGSPSGVGNLLQNFRDGYVTSPWEVAAMPWLSGPNGWMRAGLCELAGYFATPYETLPFIAFKVSGYTDLADVTVEAYVNDRPIIDEFDSVDGIIPEVQPDGVGLKTWATGGTESRQCINKSHTATCEWKPVGAQITQDSFGATIKLEQIPVIFKTRAINTLATVHAANALTAADVPFQRAIMYLEEPWQYIAPIRVTFSYSTGRSSAIYGAGDIKRSMTISSGDVTTEAQAAYKRLAHAQVQGSLTIIGDATLKLRTQVNGLEVIRITHDFSRGFLTHLDLTVPQNLYAVAVNEQKQAQITQKRITHAEESVTRVMAAVSPNLTSTGSIKQDSGIKKPPSQASWGD